MPTAIAISHFLLIGVYCTLIRKTGHPKTAKHSLFLKLSQRAVLRFLDISWAVLRIWIWQSISVCRERYNRAYEAGPRCWRYCTGVLEWNMVVFRKRNFFAKLGAKSLCFMKTSLIHRLETALKQALERVFRNSNVNSLPKPSGFL